MSQVISPENPQRVKSFIKYFNNYLAAVTVALIPIPVTNWYWVPIFVAQRHILSVMTPILCFLILALLFYYRHSLAQGMFPEITPNAGSNDSNHSKSRVGAFFSAIPVLLVLGAFGSASVYYYQLVESIRSLPPDMLPGLQFSNIPQGGILIMTFMLTFVLVEAAFGWMALKEYLQDVLQFSDVEIIKAKTQGYFSPPPEFKAIK
jgi:hypothetical protein